MFCVFEHLPSDSSIFRRSPKSRLSPRYPPFRFLSYCPYHTTAVVTHRLSVPAVTPLTTSVTGSPPLLGLLPLTTPHSRRRSSCCVHCRRPFDWGRRSSPNPAPPCFGQAIDYLHQLRRMSTTPRGPLYSAPRFPRRRYPSSKRSESKK